MSRADVLSGLIERAEAEIRRLERAIEVQRAVCEHVRAALNGQPEDALARSASSQDMPFKPDDPLPEKVRKIMLTHHRALGVSEIAALLDRYGLATQSRRGWVPMVAGVFARRKDLFKRVKRGVYKLRAEDEE